MKSPASAADEDFPLLLAVQTVQDIHQCRLARAVFTQQAVYGAGPQAELNPVVGLYPSEYFGYVTHLNC